MALADDVTAARNAARALERATAQLVGSYGDDVDARRLRVDVERVLQDLDLPEHTVLRRLVDPPVRSVFALHLTSPSRHRDEVGAFVRALEEAARPGE